MSSLKHSIRLPRSAWRRPLLALCILSVVTASGAIAAGALVPQNPRLDTPIALDGEVWAVEQVGSAIVVGGNFTQIQTERNGPIIQQAGLYAYDLDSGILLDDFLPTLTAPNGAVEVQTLEPAADGKSVYIGGKFNAIDDKTDGVARIRNRMAKLDVTTGRLDRNFALAGVDAKVLALDLVGPHLYVGGNFNNVYDASNGSLVVVDHHSLARFNPVTGAYDPTFKFEPEESIHESGMLGVTNIGHNQDKWIVISHRGQYIENINGERYERPGLAIIWVGGGVGPGLLTEFRALWPDENDPVQDFYTRDSCDGVGTVVRDLEVSADGTYFVVAHQGADRGYACDTVVRFPFSGLPQRPTWTARLFDSVFSLAIDNDAIYVGGHFRYMVAPSAPSPYPGRTAANGFDFFGQIYEADPNSDPTFRADLVDPGYVYPVGQLGALDPATGYGIPSFNPGSDALLGVLDLTLIDRGLLIGQDGGRINGFNVGRSAILDLNPDAGDPQCSVRLDADSNPVVSWRDIGDVRAWSVARNGTFQDRVTATSWTDPSSPVETDLSYELRYKRNGISQTDDCGTVSVNAVPVTCTAALSGDVATVSFTSANFDRVAIRRDGRWQATVRDQDSFSQRITAGTYSYAVRGFRGGTAVNTSCGTVSLAAAPTPDMACSVAVAGNVATVSFNGQDFKRVTVRRDGRWQATVVDANSYTQTLAPGTYAYVARGISGGVANSAGCGTVTVEAAAAPVVACSVSMQGNVVLSWNDVGARAYQVRTNDAWTATLPAGTTSWTGAAQADASYQLRYRLNGERVTVDCQ